MKISNSVFYNFFFFDRCDKCEFATALKRNLERHHIRVHSHIKPFSCPMQGCGYQVSQFNQRCQYCHRHCIHFLGNWKRRHWQTCQKSPHGYASLPMSYPHLRVQDWLQKQVAGTFSCGAPVVTSRNWRDFLEKEAHQDWGSAQESSFTPISTSQ